MNRHDIDKNWAIFDDPKSGFGHTDSFRYITIYHIPCKATTYWSFAINHPVSLYCRSCSTHIPKDTEKKLIDFSILLNIAQLDINI